MTTDDGNGATSLFVTAQDGLKLHVRRYGPTLATGLPVVCLPGLARTAEDFDTLARSLSQTRRVYALDSRGRGQSDYDRKPANYTIATELADLMAVLVALGATPAVFVGTSRGGILTMLLAVMRPGAIAGAVLNDIGPVIEPKGLVRIKSYVGKLPQPTSFEEGAEILRRLFGAQFPALTGEQWLAFSRRSFKPDRKGLAPTYDVRLASMFDGVNFDQPLPALWKEFDALAHVPLMVIRGANSDILSEATVTEMRARHPAMKTLVVPDQGHAPLLAEPTVLRQIGSFVADCDTAAPVAAAPAM